MAVRVPEANMLLITKTPIIRNSHLSFLIFVVIPKMRNATAEAAVSIKYVAPFIGFVLDTHLYSEAKMPKNELKEVMEHFYGKGTSAVSKMSGSNQSNEAEYLYQTVKEIMKTHTN